MANAEVGAAYVSVTAAIDKSFSKDVSNAISGAAEGAGDVGTQGGELFRSGLLSNFGGFAQKMLAAVGVAKILKGLKDIGEQAFFAYADYEQLAGGVTKLFGADAAATVEENARQAFSTAGLSANEYMETVTGFSASLISSLDGDTAKAAEVADKAIRDMSDNANTFGTDMASIQFAYQGFAKQQYSMLDNLKLGYGGSKAEMERLLADAEAISGVHYDISNYADVVEAIHQIQEQQHITGTTAAEAAGTVSGSIASVKSSWQNLLAELGKEDADLDRVAQDLADSLVNAAKNAFALIGRLAKNAVKAIPKVFSTLVKSILKAVGWEKFAAETMRAWADVRKKIDDKLNEIKASVSNAFNAVKNTAINIWNGIKNGISNAISAARNTISSVVSSIAGTVSSVFNGVRNTVASIWNGITSAVSNAVNAVRNTIGSVLGGITGTVSGIFNAVKSAISGPLEAAKSVVSRIVGAIKSFFNFSISWPHIPMPYFVINPPGWSIGDLLKGSIPSLDIGWKAKGGIVEDMTLIGAGEKGAELIWPAYDPYLSKYAAAIADNMPNGGAGGTTLIIDRATVNSDAQIQRCMLDLLTTLERKGRM